MLHSTLNITLTEKAKLAQLIRSHCIDSEDTEDVLLKKINDKFLEEDCLENIMVIAIEDNYIDILECLKELQQVGKFNFNNYWWGWSPSEEAQQWLKNNNYTEGLESSGFITQKNEGIFRLIDEALGDV